MSASEPLLTVQQVAERFGVPVSWVYQKCDSGELPSRKLGHYRRLVPSEIESFLDSCRQESSRGKGRS